MGLQLSILIGCIGALELVACVRHIAVCMLNLTDHPSSSCCIDYFHRSRPLSDGNTLVGKSSADCSEIEAILRETRSEPDVLCLGPPRSPADNCVRLKTTNMSSLPLGSQTDEATTHENDRVLIEKLTNDLALPLNELPSQPSDPSSLANTEAKPKGIAAKSSTKRIVRRSKTPEVRIKRELGDLNDENEEAKLQQKKLHRTTKSTSAVASKRSAKLKCKNTELGKSAENLTTIKRTKRQRDPERCKSEIQIRDVAANRNNVRRDEWTNTSPIGSECTLSRASSKRSISVLIQTSFEDRLFCPESNRVFPNSSAKLSSVCPNCNSCTDEGPSREVRRVTIAKTDSKTQLVKVSSFEQASGDDYENLRNVIGNTLSTKKDWHEGGVKLSIDNESFDSEYVDAEDEGSSVLEQPIQFNIPDPGDNKAFWLIFSGEYTKAMNKDWHSGHFCCWQCDESLTGQRYVLRDEHPYCIKCYESVFANGCEECHKIIGIDSKDLSYKDKHWHEACFLCNKCRVSLVDKQFGSKLDKIYCGNCYDAQFASRCDGCGEIFRAGTKKMEYKTRQWHEKCFCCVVCKNPIGTKSFIPREQEIYCAGCYEDKFATRCVKCNQIITSGGVTYKNEPWHRDCFTCSHCNQSLAGQRFTSRDEKPYCANCFGELFAKRCTACTKPITGIGGTRFISFEDRHWHNDCFICAGCKTSLVGRGFITDAEDIICPECAKQKLS
ncbi:calponin homology and LIM domain-containing protein isoform X1 [Copidosoma floridanum]|uniref:calponin homology and LIM domain-containing protein isoform X1 n=2 Tax=Copidosoma floridanum TaxID=29053 RepID=UPI0006C9453B|nr:calponin homology and LIM domain-containing protein isoform X1 [Copidosoma floridanum]